MNYTEMILNSAKKTPREEDAILAEDIGERSVSLELSENRYVKASIRTQPTIQEFTIMFLKQKVEDLTERIRKLEEREIPRVPFDMQNIIKNILKPRRDPFDSSQYSWRPTSEELANLQKILEEDY